MTVINITVVFPECYDIDSMYYIHPLRKAPSLFTFLSHALPIKQKKSVILVMIMMTVW